MNGSVDLKGVGRWLVSSAVGLLVLMLSVSVGQERPSTPQTVQDRASAESGLTVGLSQDGTLEPSESVPLKACLAAHPPLFCVLFTLVITNTGENTILAVGGSCEGPQITFDLRRSDGSWRNFPPKMGITCSSNMLGVQSLAPHESSIMHIRFSDLFLDMDTSEARVEAAGRGPFVIRANWTIWGCAASGKLKKGISVDFLTASSLCSGGTAPRRDFALLRSNELEVRF
jgi:hypothetical protein